MNTFAPAAELQALEKLRDEELEEARALQSVMLPTESLRSRGRLLKLSGIPPGLWPCTSYDATVLRLEPGDSVLFCTNGVTDSMNVDEESFGTDRLVALCDQHLADSPTHLLQSIFWAVDSFSQGRGPHDDMAAALFYCSE